MRLVVISQAADLQTLRRILFAGTQPAAATAAALERVKALNPHVDLQRLAAGSVLLVPDLPGVTPAHSRSIGGDEFAGLATDAINGLKAAAQRVRTGAETLVADGTAVSAVLRTAAVKRILDSDATLAKQLDTARARASVDQKQAQEAVTALETLTQQAANELAALAKLFG